MLLAIGHPAPLFVAPTASNPQFHFGSAAGRYIALSFLNSAQADHSPPILAALGQHRRLFDDDFCCFFGVSSCPEDVLEEQIPGIRWFRDLDYSLARRFGVMGDDNEYQPCTFLFDERLRVLAVFPIGAQPETHISQLSAFLSQLPPFPESRPALTPAPVLVTPRIFSSKLCQALIAYYQRQGGEESGFMSERDGRTVVVADSSVKRRRDRVILDETLREAALFGIRERLAPEIYKAFQFQATRIERHIVACYDSADQGFFQPHRDNLTKGTAHRKFAVSLNLNTGEYEGGCLRFPEFGRQTYSAPLGGAVVFSCSLLHEATPVTAGRRYAYLPFLYDDEAAQIREQNLRFVDLTPPTSAKTRGQGFGEGKKPSRPRKKSS
ncbi:MAG: redoxin domain-containing protein [Cyanobacteria bacterium RI_101]|nr:redoxin domain-containing protein [Cyanobacteria bacterium RI_101]